MITSSSLEDEVGTRMGRIVMLLAAIPAPRRTAAQAHQNAVIDLWAQGKPAFGVYAPNEAVRGQPPVYTREGGQKLATNPLYDFVFLNLEGSYDAAAVRPTGRPAEVGPQDADRPHPADQKDGADATKARVKEILDAGADGVTIPHIRNLDEAKQAIGFFRTRRRTSGRRKIRGAKLAMLMLEDPAAVAQAKRLPR